MSVVIDHEVVRRQLAEIEEAQAERDHRADLRRRRAIQGLSAVGLLSSAAREAYRREVFETLPTARYVVGGERHWLTTMHPGRESVGGSVAETSSHAASIALSAIGGDKRASERPWLSLAAAGFLTFRAVAAGRQLVEELEDGHLDIFTTLNAVTSAAAVPLAIPEAVRAFKSLFDR